MELLFNLAWVVLSLLLMAGLSARSAGPHRCMRACNAGVRFTAAFLLSFLLLPVISMTDDLHAVITMAESERASQIVTSAHECHQHCQAPVHPACLTLRYQPGCLSVYLGAVVPAAFSSAATLQTAALHEGRAPPPNSLG